MLIGNIIELESTTVFDLFFQNNPFGGKYTIFAGLGECLTFLENFHYKDNDIDFITSLISDVEDEFLTYLR